MFFDKGGHAIQPCTTVDCGGPTYSHGAYYDSEEDAAKAFSDHYFGQAQGQQKEYGATIYQTSHFVRTKYYLGQPSVGTNNSVRYITNSFRHTNDVVCASVHIHVLPRYQNASDRDIEEAVDKAKKVGNGYKERLYVVGTLRGISLTVVDESGVCEFMRIGYASDRRHGSPFPCTVIEIY